MNDNQMPAPGLAMTNNVMSEVTKMTPPNTGQKVISSAKSSQNGGKVKRKIILADLGKMRKVIMDTHQVQDGPKTGRVVVPLHSEKDLFMTGGMVGSPVLAYGNGPLLTNVEVITIFWGNSWTQAPQTTLVTRINEFFDFILTSSLIDMLGEYNVPGKAIGHGSRIGTYTETGSQPGGNTGNITDAEMQQQLQTWINNHNVSEPNANTLYFIYLPNGVSLSGPAGSGASCTDFCGYHWYISGSNPEIYYAAMPFPGCNGCLGGLAEIDSLTSVSSHELCESITDPQPWSGWNSAQGEIGDICAWQTQLLGGFTVQKEWSNSQGACVVQPSTPQVGPWSGWNSLGGWIDRLTVGKNQDGRLEVFARGSDGAVWHNWQVVPNGNWSGWNSLGGWVDIVSVAANQDGRLELFARGADGAVWHNWQVAPNGNWSGWNSLGGWVDLISVGQNADGRLEIFARGADKALWHNWQVTPNGNWSGWNSLSGWIDMISLNQNQDGRLEIFARGSDGAVWHIWQTAPNSGWSGWNSLSGWIDMLTIGKNQDGRLEIFARGADKAVWHNWQVTPNGNWSGWNSMGGWIDEIAVGNNLDGRLELFARGSDQALWHNWQTAPNNGWSGWNSLGGWIDMLAVDENADGRLEVFARGSDAAVWHNWQTSPNN